VEETAFCKGALLGCYQVEERGKLKKQEVWQVEAIQTEGASRRDSMQKNGKRPKKRAHSS